MRVTHNRQMAYLPTDKLTTDKYLSATKDVTDPYVLKSVNEKIVQWAESLNRVNTERWTIHDVVTYIKRGAEEVSFSDYARTHINRLIDKGQERNARNYQLAVQHLERFMGTNKGSSDIWSDDDAISLHNISKTAVTGIEVCS